MSYDNSNRPKSYPMTPETNYTPWIGGLAVLLIVLGVIAAMSYTGQPNAGATNKPVVTSSTPSR